MEILSKLLSDQGSTLISSLVSKGFSQEQAEGFLPQAVENITSVMSNASDTDGAGSVLDKIDINSLAEKVNLDAGLVNNGLQSIVPLVLEKFGRGDFGADNLGGLLGSVKKFF